MDFVRRRTAGSRSLLLLLALCFAPLAVVAGGESVAEIDGQAITLEELEAHTATQLRQLDLQRHNILDQGLQTLIDERLLTAEAERQGLSSEELLAKRMEGDKEITEAEVDAWYEENKARVRQPKENVAEQIRNFLSHERQQDARRALLAELRSSNGVRILLEPMRVDVAAESGPEYGRADAPIQIVEFSDFQCPYCERINSTFTEVKKKYGDKVAVTFRQFPLHSIHPQAQKAAEASLCAKEQGKFWEMHDAMFARQRELEVDQLKARASEIGLDTAAFGKCLDSDRFRDAVMADVKAGADAGVSGTPSLFINGRPLQLRGDLPPIDQLSKVIDDELARRSR